MAETLGFAVAVMVFEFRVLFGTIIPRQLEDSLERVGVDVVVGAGHVAQEVKVEFRRG